jgi:hypothetical protein
MGVLLEGQLEKHEIVALINEVTRRGCVLDPNVIKSTIITILSTKNKMKHLHEITCLNKT